MKRRKKRKHSKTMPITEPLRLHKFPSFGNLEPPGLPEVEEFTDKQVTNAFKNKKTHSRKVDGFETARVQFKSNDALEFEVKSDTNPSPMI